MNKNYYEILQINKNASSDVIERVYKLLVKKYHPDLQPAEKKQKAEEALKIINEAYEILSNKDKRIEYDSTLNDMFVPFAQYDELSKQFDNLKNELNIIRENNINYKENNNNNSDIDYSVNSFSNQDYTNQEQQDYLYKENIKQAQHKAYYDAYIQDLKNRGYKIKYKKSLKDYIIGFTSICITILIFAILWQIPFFKNFIMDNPVFRSIINIFSNAI